MQCHVHNDQAAELRCTICEKPICEWCTRHDRGKAYCEGCLEEGRAYNQMRADRPVPPPIDPRTWGALAFAVVIFLIGGVGMAIAGAISVFWVFVNGASTSRINDGVLAFAMVLIVVKAMLSLAA